MKKTVLLLFLAIMVMVMFSTAVSASSVNVGDLIKDKAGWENIKDGTFDGDKLTVKANNGPIAYTAKKFKDETFQVRAAFDTTPNGWPGFMLRGSSATTDIWEGQTGYLVIFKETSMEVQRWRNGTQKWLIGDTPPVPHNGAIKNGGTHDIVMSAKDESAGIRIVVSVDGKEIINVLDENSLVGEGYFGIMAYAKDVTIQGASVSSEGTTSLPKTGSNNPVAYLYALTLLLIVAGVFMQLRRRNARKN